MQLTKKNNSKLLKWMSPAWLQPKSFFSKSRKYPILIILFTLFLGSCQGSPPPPSKPAPEVNLTPYHFALANQLFEFKLFSEAAEEYEKVLEIIPNHQPSLGYLGITYLKLGEREKAAEHWKKSLKLFPEEKQKIETFYNLSLIYASLNKKDHSIFYIYQTLKLSSLYKVNRFKKLSQVSLSKLKKHYGLTDAYIEKIGENLSKIKY